MLSFGFIISTKCPFLMPTDIAHTCNVLHNLYLPHWLQKPAATALNSTLTMLMVEYGGRANLIGILKVELYELARLMFPNPVGVTAAPCHALTASEHAPEPEIAAPKSGFRLTLADTRRIIDAPVFDYLGLTGDEQNDLYVAAYDAIVKRQIAEANVS